jgi:hypothetical protein
MCRFIRGLERILYLSIELAVGIDEGLSEHFRMIHGHGELPMSVSVPPPIFRIAMFCDASDFRSGFASGFDDGGDSSYVLAYLAPMFSFLMGPGERQLPSADILIDVASTLGHHTPVLFALKA